MTSIDTSDFDHPGREDIYEYVVSHGATRPEKLRRALDMGERAFGHHTTVLKRDSILEDHDGKLKIATDSGVKRESDASAGEPSRDSFSRRNQISRT